MRKFLLSLSCVLGTLPIFADAFTYTYEGQTINYFTTKSGECSVGMNQSIIGQVSIPQMVTYNGNEFTVTSLGARAFGDCSELTSITLPQSVTSIGESAFSGCSSLTSIVIPEDVAYIESFAFYDCSSLTSVTLSNNISDIKTFAFANCTSLTAIDLPASITNLGSNIFQGCSGLTSVTIPDSATSIDNGAFNGCLSLTSVTLGSSLFGIYDNVFENCDNLKDVISLSDYPPSVYDIGSEYDPSKCNLYVPEGSEEAYRNAYWWSEFASIRAISASASTISSETITVKVYNDNIIIINGKIGASVTIYDITGLQVAKTKLANTVQSIDVSRNGVFFVNINDATYKIVL